MVKSVKKEEEEEEDNAVDGGGEPQPPVTKKLKKTNAGVDVDVGDVNVKKENDDDDDEDINDEEGEEDIEEESEEEEGSDEDDDDSDNGRDDDSCNTEIFQDHNVDFDAETEKKYKWKYSGKGSQLKRERLTRFEEAHSQLESIPNKELDKRIKDLIKTLQQKPNMSMKWKAKICASGLFQSIEERVELSLCLGWDDKFRDDIFHDDAENFLGPTGRAGLVADGIAEVIDDEIEAQYDDLDYDSEAAFKTLCEEGEVSLFEDYLKDQDFGNFCSISMDPKIKKLRKENALDLMGSIFQGDLCAYPEEYDNFGMTIFGKTKKPYLEIMNIVAMIFKRSKDVSCIRFYAGWQDENSECECQHYTFFELKSGDKFLLKFRSEWSAG